MPSIFFSFSVLYVLRQYCLVNKILTDSVLLAVQHVPSDPLVYPTIPAHNLQALMCPQDPLPFVSLVLTLQVLPNMFSFVHGY